MQEWFDLAQDESNMVNEGKPGDPYQQVVKIVNGQFFCLMKLLNERKTNYKCLGIPKPCRKTKRNSHMKISYILEAPFPNLLIYELSWPNNNIKATNTFQVLASLPPFFFVPNAYSLDISKGDKNEFKYMYKLQSMICWTGRHYLTIMRIILGDSQKKEWQMMNDTEIRSFNSWIEVINTLMETGCCPTVLIYERQVLTEPVSMREIRTIRSLLTADQLESLTYLAGTIEKDIEDFKIMQMEQ